MKSAIRNDQLIPEDEACAPVSIKEVFYNVGVFESLKILKGKAVFFEDHLDRLFESAKRLEIPFHYTKEKLADLAYQLIKSDSIDRATLRIHLIGGNSPLLFMLHTELPRYQVSCYRRGVQVISWRGERIVPEVKSTSLLLNYLALREAERQQAMEAVFVDRRGHAVEGTRTNVFAVKGSDLFTAGSGVLAGVTRKHIINHASQLGLSVRYDRIRLDSILEGKYDELFLSSTSMGAMPVQSVDHVRINDQFAVTQRIHQHIRALEAAYIASYE